MWRQILCTIVSVAVCIFWFLFIVKGIFKVPKQLEKVKGLQQEIAKELSWQEKKINYTTFICVGIVFGSFCVNGLLKASVLLGIYLSAVVVVGVVLTLVMRQFWRNLTDKYGIEFLPNKSLVLNKSFWGEEGFYGAVLVGLSVYQLIALIAGVF